MGLTGAYGQVDRRQSERTLLSAVENGITFFDTADVYGNGKNEELVGTVLRPHRHAIVLATKGGATRDALGNATNDGSPGYLRKACEASLRRLGVDAIDLYYLHRVDPAVPIEASMEALARLVEQGKIRSIGLSEAGASTLRRACAVHPVAALQTEYSLACRFPENELLATCEELGVSFVAYSPLSRGLLGGAIAAQQTFGPDDMRRVIPRFQSQNLQANVAATQALAELAGQLQASPAQLALAWVLSRSTTLFAIPGARSADRIAENAGACQVRIPEWARQKLESIFSGDAIQGARHTSQMLARTGL
ncbi:aldo/keto reductase [Comamonas odontotermitis]|uniref:aldo/keto reductase n=1 Tax=Comamonas odontotermitis TaxID=379895 RepID=UPI00366D47C4